MFARAYLAHKPEAQRQHEQRTAAAGGAHKSLAAVDVGPMSWHLSCTKKLERMNINGKSGF